MASSISSPPILPADPAAQEQPVQQKGRYRAWADKNPNRAMAVKYGAISLVALAVIGGLIALTMTGQFNSTGWLRQTALPAMGEAFQKAGHWITGTAVPAVRKFMDMKANLSIGQGLAFIAAPIAGAGIVTILGVKFGPRIKASMKEKYQEYKQSKEQKSDNKSRGCGWFSLAPNFDGVNLLA